MAFDNIKISDLDNIVTISNSDLIELASPASIIYSMYMSKKTTIDKIGEWLCTVFSFSQSLQTTTKTIVGALNELFNKKEQPQGAGFHNSIYRGQYLGQHPTEAQLEAINNGTFDDLFIGDYWSADPADDSSVRFRIAAFDYYYGVGETPCNTHHVVIVPDQVARANSYYESYSTRGAYKYAWCRGYYYYDRSYTTTEENQTTFNLDDDHYVGCPNVEFVCCVYMSDPTVSGYIYWDLAEEPSGNDCIVKIKGGSHYHTSNPASTFSGGIPSGTQIKVYYKGKIQPPYYYPKSYPLTAFEVMINQLFTSTNNILNFPLLATTEHTNQPGLVTTEWIEGRVEFMTEQQLNGIRTLGRKYNFETDTIFTNGHYQYNRKRFETTADSIQFPLFKLNPGLRHVRFKPPNSSWEVGYQFWLRDRSYEDQILWTDDIYEIQSGAQSKVEGITDYYGGYWVAPQKQVSYGIRPYFCLYKGLEVNG